MSNNNVNNINNKIRKGNPVSPGGASISSDDMGSNFWDDSEPRKIIAQPEIIGTLQNNRTVEEYQRILRYFRDVMSEFKVKRHGNFLNKPTEKRTTMVESACELMYMFKTLKESIESVENEFIVCDQTCKLISEDSQGPLFFNHDYEVTGTSKPSDFSFNEQSAPNSFSTGNSTSSFTFGKSG